MSPRAPENYRTLSEALKTRYESISIIGMVTDHMPPRQTSGDDLLCSLRIQDPDLFASYHDPSGLRVRYFGRERDLIPKVKSLGDFVILRDVMIKEIRHEVTVVSQKYSSCIVVYNEEVPEPAFQAPYEDQKRLLHSSTRSARELSIPEQLYVIQLKDALKPLGLASKQPIQDLQARPAPTSGVPNRDRTHPRGDKFSLIESIKSQTFYDLVGQVVKVFPTSYGDIDLYVTDYTSNSLLPQYSSPDESPNVEAHDQYGDEFGYTKREKQKWPGPYGKMTLKIDLQPPHASYAQFQVKVNDFVSLKNVRIKNDRRGNIEGNIFPDKFARDRVLVQKIATNKDERVRDIKLRKEQYDKSLKTISAPEIPDKKLSKGRRSKLRKRQKAEAASLDEKGNPSEAISANDGKNNHVQCNNPSVGLTTVTQIVNNPYLQDKTPSGIERTLPFINAKYRSRIRVVDFYPQNLEDFARSLEDSMYEDAEQGDREDKNSMDMDVEVEKKWEWAFFLLVEDAKQPKTAHETIKLKLLVSGGDAECLLKLDATDLRNDKKALEKLREKLFILWGDLEEIKAKSTTTGDATDSTFPRNGTSGLSSSSVPFECCIMEYGVSVESTPMDDGDMDPQWVRMHKIFGTTIMV